MACCLSRPIFLCCPLSLFQYEITTCPLSCAAPAFCVVRLGTDAIIVMGELRAWQKYLEAFEDGRKSHLRIQSVSIHEYGGPLAAGSTTMSAPQRQTDRQTETGIATFF